MSDLIQLEDAINAICGGCKAHTDYECAECGLGEFFRRIANIKTVDAVEVVRCKDCYYYTPVKEYLDKAGECNKHGRRFVVWSNGFCSLGVNKEDIDEYYE